MCICKLLTSNIENLIEQYSLCFRFCFVEFDGGKCMLELREKGLEGADFVNTHCPNIVKGRAAHLKAVNYLSILIANDRS